MLPTYRVRVVARYLPDVQLMGRVDASSVSDVTDARPEWDTTAVHWDRSSGTDVAQTLTVIYEAEGRNPREAAQFARAIFECERKRAALPLPAMLAVFPE
jgi:hypothetical protein